MMKLIADRTAMASLLEAVAETGGLRVQDLVLGYNLRATPYGMLRRILMKGVQHLQVQHLPLGHFKRLAGGSASIVQQWQSFHSLSLLIISHFSFRAWM